MESSTQQAKEISRDTLRILHLPSFLSHTQRERMLKKYSAIAVKTVNKSEKYAITFAKFPSKEAARQAFLRLHQLEVRGHRLTVEYARESATEFSEFENRRTEDSNNDSYREEFAEPDFQIFIKKLNGWAFSQVLTQPPPPNIWYKYPPPTTSTLSRIAIQMLKEPVFYRQVLHLMNKMNLPPPFPELEPEFPFLKDIYDVERYRDIFGWTANTGKEENFSEDEESELETEDDTEFRPKEIIPIKRKRAPSGKRLKIAKYVNLSKRTVNVSSNSQKLVKPEDVFESLHRSEGKGLKIALKMDVDVDSERLLDIGGGTGSTTFIHQEEGGFGLLYPLKKRDNTDAENNDATSHRSAEFITSEELAANRVSINDQRMLPVFKNYHPGKPSCRLYIKNLSKQVESNDLDFIYKKYMLPDAKDGNVASQYNIRLMQEGRMKGQAFVTLPTVEYAQTALEETNGYILKDKPMVVQFAKIASKPKTL